MEQMNSRRINMILALAIIGVIALYVVFVFLPNRREAIAMERQLQADRAFVAQTSGLAAKITDETRQLKQVEHYTGEWNERMPSESDLPKLFAKLDRLAGAAGVTTVSIDPLPVVEQETLQQFPVTLALNGSFHEVFRFLKSIENLRMPIWVDSLEIEKLRKDARDVECELTLVMFARKSESSD